MIHWKDETWSTPWIWKDSFIPYIICSEDWVVGTGWSRQASWQSETCGLLCSWWISWPCWCCPVCIFLRFCVLRITVSLGVKWSRFGNKTFSWPLVHKGNFRITKWTYPMIHFGIISEEVQPWSSHHLLCNTFHYLSIIQERECRTISNWDCSMVEIHLDFSGCLDLLSLVEAGKEQALSLTRKRYAVLFINTINDLGRNSCFLQFTWSTKKNWCTINKLFSSHRFWKDLEK